MRSLFATVVVVCLAAMVVAPPPPYASCVQLNLAQSVFGPNTCSTPPSTCGHASSADYPLELSTTIKALKAGVITSIKFPDCGGHAGLGPTNRHLFKLYTCTSQPVLPSYSSCTVVTPSQFSGNEPTAACTVNEILLTNPIAIPKDDFFVVSVTIYDDLGNYRDTGNFGFPFPATATLTPANSLQAIGSASRTVPAVGSPTDWATANPPHNYLVDVGFFPCTVDACLDPTYLECNTALYPLSSNTNLAPLPGTNLPSLATDSAGCRVPIHVESFTPLACPNLGTVTFRPTATANTPLSLCGPLADFTRTLRSTTPPPAAIGGLHPGTDTCSTTAPLVSNTANKYFCSLQMTPAASNPTPSNPTLPVGAGFSPITVTNGVTSSSATFRLCCNPTPAEGSNFSPTCPRNAISQTEGWIKVLAYRRGSYDCDKLDWEDVYVGCGNKIKVTLNYPNPSTTSKNCPNERVETYNFDQYPGTIGVTASQVVVNFQRVDKCGLVSCGCTVPPTAP